MCLVMETSTFVDMEMSPKQDTAGRRRRSERVRLDVGLYDELATARGIGNVSQQAKYHGVLRPHWSAIRHGHKEPSAALALRVAEQLAVAPGSIWRREMER